MLCRVTAISINMCVCVCVCVCVCAYLCVYLCMHACMRLCVQDVQTSNKAKIKIAIILYEECTVRTCIYMTLYLSCVKRHKFHTLARAVGESSHKIQLSRWSM